MSMSIVLANIAIFLTIIITVPSVISGKENNNNNGNSSLVEFQCFCCIATDIVQYCNDKTDYGTNSLI